MFEDIKALILLRLDGVCKCILLNSELPKLPEGYDYNQYFSFKNRIRTGPPLVILEGNFGFSVEMLGELFPKLSIDEVKTLSEIKTCINECTDNVLKYELDIWIEDNA